MSPHHFEYAHAHSHLWLGITMPSPVTRRCRTCGLIEIRGVMSGDEFVALYRPTEPCGAAVVATAAAGLGIDPRD